MLVESFSGVRGIYGKDIKKKTIVSYALAYSGFLKKKKRKSLVVIGMDTRPSSNEVKEIMKNAFLENGIGVIDVGVNTTPAIELGVRIFKAGGGAIITASHNEPEWNGWKFLSEKGSILPAEDAEEVIKASRSSSKPAPGEKGKEENREKELREAYVSFVMDILGEKGVSAIKKSKPKVVADPNGGAASVIIREVFEKAGIEGIYKNMKAGVFKRLIEPNEKSLAYLSFHVEDNDADLGAGWDCDADRVELVIPGNSDFAKRNGKMLSGQYILALLVEEVMSNYKGKNRLVVTNDATSNVVSDIAERHNAKVVEAEVGEANVVEKMDKLKAPVGGEGSSSGGIFPPSKCRDGILTLMMILKLSAERKRSIGEILEGFPQYYNSVAKAKCDAGKAVDARKGIEEYWKKQPFIREIRKTGNEAGGLKIIREDGGWVWFRASKTEAGIFRIISDAKSKEYADKLLAMGEKSFNDAMAEIR